MDLQAIARRGQAARELLSNDLFRDSLHALRQDLLIQMQAVKLDDTGSHTRLIMALQLANAHERFVVNAINDGVQAEQAMQASGKRID